LGTGFSLRQGGGRRSTTIVPSSTGFGVLISEVSMHNAK
jgi:hypothetical protein